MQDFLESMPEEVREFAEQTLPRLVQMSNNDLMKLFQLVGGLIRYRTPSLVVSVAIVQGESFMVANMDGDPKSLMDVLMAMADQAFQRYLKEKSKSN